MIRRALASGFSLALIASSSGAPALAQVRIAVSEVPARGVVAPVNAPQADLSALSVELREQTSLPAIGSPDISPPAAASLTTARQAPIGAAAQALVAPISAAAPVFLPVADRALAAPLPAAAPAESRQGALFSRPAGEGRAPALENAGQAELPEDNPTTREGVHAFQRAALAAGEWTKPDDAAPAADSPQPERIPSSFRLFLAGSLPYQFGSWTGSVVMPLEANEMVGPDGSIWGQAVLYVFLILGNVLGARWTKRHGSRTVFIASAIGVAAAVLIGSFSGGLTGFLLARALNGLAGGVVIGVGENTIMRETLGNNRGRLDRGNALYSIANNGMGVVAPLLVAFLWSWTGSIPLVLAAAAASVLGVAPWLFMPAAPASQAETSPGEPARKAVLPAGARAAYVFSMFVRMAFFGLIGPLFAIAVFGNPALTGALIGLYSLGNLVTAAALSLSESRKEALRARAPRLLGWFGWDERRWLKVGVATLALFFAASFLLPQAPWAALVLAAAVGFAIQGSLTKWKSLIQARVEEASQPSVFKSLFNAAGGAILAAFGVVTLAPLAGLGLSTYWLLAGVSLAVALAGVLVHASGGFGPKKA